MLIQYKELLIYFIIRMSQIQNSTNPDKPQSEKSTPPLFSQPQTMTVKGALIGAVITAFISWNTGRYSRIGTFIKRWRFMRSFVEIKKRPQSFPITNYHRPLLDTVANNFYCYSGEPGIGKSVHFQNLIAAESLSRPSLYVSFKAIGRENNFQRDIGQQLGFGEDETNMLTEIIRAAQRIHNININPHRFQLKCLLASLSLASLHLVLWRTGLSQVIKLALSSVLVFGQLYHIHFISPFLRQSARKSAPVVVFDDLNKIQQLGMLAEVVRFLRLVQEQAANIILVSSDEETWARLRREPGMKDRLRVRQMKYDYIETATRITQALDRSQQTFRLQILAHPIYQRVIIRALVRDLIALRQMSLRRFVSVMRLVDEQFYESFVQVLNNKKQLPLDDIVVTLRDILLDSQAETMVSNLKIIKRELSALSSEEFLVSLELLLRKQKLPQDNKLGCILKLYNIVRDLRSEYVINGRYTYTVYQMAVNKYRQDLEEYKLIGEKKQD